MNIHQFQSVIGKFPGMRKDVDWTVCPRSSAADREVIIQSEKRIAKVNLDSGKAIVSTGKGGHNGFMHLNPILGAKEVDCPQNILDQLKGMEIPAGAVRVL